MLKSKLNCYFGHLKLMDIQTSRNLDPNNYSNIYACIFFQIENCMYIHIHQKLSENAPMTVNIIYPNIYSVHLQHYELIKWDCNLFLLYIFSLEKFVMTYD
jgi:hypothetical protein